MLLCASRLVLEQHDRLGTGLSAAIHPHVRLTLRALAVFMQHLHPGLVAMDERLRQEHTMHRVIQALQMALARANHPVSHRVAAQFDSRTAQYRFHPVQRHAVGILAGHDGGNRGRIGHAAWQRLRRHGGAHDRGAHPVPFAMVATIFEPDMLPDPRRLGWNMQLFTDIFADAVQRALTACGAAEVLAR